MDRWIDIEGCRRLSYRCRLMQRSTVAVAWFGSDTDVTSEDEEDRARAHTGALSTWCASWHSARFPPRIGSRHEHEYASCQLQQRGGTNVSTCARLQ